MTRLSNRQYPLLRMFAKNGPQFHMSIEQAQHFDQRPFRSMLIRKWIVFRPGKGFHITAAGLDAYNEFLHTDIARKNADLPLTAYFDATAYALHSRRPRVIQMRKAS